MSCLEADQHVLSTSKHSDSPSLASTDDEYSTQSSTPIYFAAHQYELEVTPEHPIELSKEIPLTKVFSKRTSRASPTLRSESRIPISKHQQENIETKSKISPYVVTETSRPMTKTVYLIRHAESDENRRKESFRSSVKELGKLKLPKREDVVASIELMNLVAQLDSNVSPRGQAQIDQLGKLIAKDNFVSKMGIQLVAHSPLLRARQTCFGMLRCVAPTSKLNDNFKNKPHNDPLVHGCKHPSVQRVVELDMLSERTPMEWFPVQHDAFTKRIAEFEMWLSEQPEEVIAIVGHSLYFKNMLGLESKFRNVDVWSLQFDFTVENSIRRVRKDIHAANENETKKKIRKQLDKIGNIMNRSEKKDNFTIFTALSNDDEIVEIHDMTHSKKEVDNSDLGHQSSIDGVLLEELELPRGWRDLKHHYRYDPSYVE